MIGLATQTNTQSADVQQAVEQIEAMLLAQVSQERLSPGAALAVCANGSLVVDLVTGYADTQRATMLDAASLFPMFSGSKPLGAVALWQQIERGLIALDDRVADYWPAFGQNGKDSVSIRHILSHQGGFPSNPPELTPETWDDFERINQVIEQLRPEFEPGSVSAYHFLTQHWVIAELIRLVDGRSYRDYLQDEILAPLGLVNTHISVGRDLDEHCVMLHATDGTDPWGIEILQSMHAHPIYRHVVPGASLVSNAAGMARFYCAIALGGAIDCARILRPETVDQMLEIAVLDEIDPSFELHARRSYGFELGGLAEPRRHWPGATSTIRTFWHGGMGTSVCWADRDTGLAVAYLTNGVRRDKAGAIARRDLSDLVRTLLT
jgi:CubicO group peptidase (beta-lactamase class C family)